MRKIVQAAVAALAILGLAGTAEAKRLPPEQQLAKLLKGRVAGEPQDCIYLPIVRESRIIQETAIVYESAGVLWVNRPQGASHLDDDDIIVTKTHDTRLCSIDIVRLHDRTTRSFSGFVSLEKFVPYRKVKRGL